MRVLVVDDEPRAAAGLARKLRELRADWQVEQETRPVAALAKLQADPPDLLFLDIAMPELDGFALLKQLPTEQRQFQLVFCTAYDEHALKAFDAGARDYLVKPVDPERLQQTIARLEQQVAPSAEQQDWLDQAGSYLDRLMIRGRRGHEVLLIKDVYCFQSEEAETVAYGETREWVVDLSLTELEQRLDPRLFARSHRSALVNLSKVARVSEDNAIHFHDSARTAPVSRRLKKELLGKLK